MLYYMQKIDDFIYLFIHLFICFDGFILEFVSLILFILFGFFFSLGV